MNPEDLVVGQEYTKDGRSYVYIGPDNATGRHVFRQPSKGWTPDEFVAWNRLGTDRLTPKPEPFFEEGKTYVHKHKKLKVEAVREGPPGLGPAALVLYTVNDTTPFWRVQCLADYQRDLWVEQ